ncbi:MAG: DUF4474 domain-containing protein [Bacteroidales bacterium]|nr:DUF4474 domain-containing protein [Clostridium sp.]MCM1202870.1 DUF4474 domain-containing protein [Bacteroidales bacterium]
MDWCEKCSLLEELAEPLGYLYHCRHGFFSSSVDAWQRRAGYTYLYDYTAPRFNMVFDALPVYFDYDEKTWLIEFWKGQYGINTGGEIGIYHADRIIPPEDYKTTMFDCASDGEMLSCSLTLYHKNGRCVRVAERHWWLTAFLTGCFSQPSDLIMEIGITFPDEEMLSAFISGMHHAGYTAKDFQVFGLRLTFSFCRIFQKEKSLLTRLQCGFSQWQNKLSCKLYLWITGVFCTTHDRILYLYYYLPFAFRKTLQLHKFNKRCHRKKRCMRRRL